MLALLSKYNNLPIAVMKEHMLQQETGNIINAMICKRIKLFFGSYSGPDNIVFSFTHIVAHGHPHRVHILERLGWDKPVQFIYFKVGEQCGHKPCFIKLNQVFTRKQYLAGERQKNIASTMKKLLFLVLLKLFTHEDCFAQIEKDTIIILPIKTAPPANSYKAGSLKAGNNATQTHCDYDEVIRAAKDEARAMGGNVIKITELIPPALVSKCYKIKADVYFAPAFRDSVLAKMNATAGEHAAITTPHATLRIYRLKDTVAFATAYYLHLDNDSVICKARSRWAEAINIYKEGPATLWAKTGARKELKLDIKTGETYYVRCGLVKGGLRNAPALELVDRQTGEAEYKEPKGNGKSAEVRYLQEIH